MDRSKIVAVITGAIALILSIAYLVIVQLLDFRGEMLPAPVDLVLPPLPLTPLIPLAGAHLSFPWILR